MGPPRSPEPFAPPPPGSPARSQAKRQGKEVAAGFAFAFAVPLAIAFILASFFFPIVDQLPAPLGLFVIFGPGIWQAVWVAPMWFVFHKKGKTGFAQGLAIGASAIFLLSGACFGLVFATFGIR